MKDSKEKEHRISHLKDMMEGIKETSEEKPDDADEVEEYEIVDADELIHELNAEEKQNFEEETFEIDDEFIYSPNKDSEEAEILEEIDEDFIIKTEINNSETDYEEDEEDILYDSEDKISEQFNNIVHARVGNYPIMAVVSLAVGIILLIVSIFSLSTQTSERVIDSVASGELNVIIVIAAFIGILFIVVGIYKLFSLKNPFGDLTKKIDKDLNNLFKYYRGIAFYKKRDFSRALYLFNSIKEGEFFSKANYYSAGIYFTLGEYSNAIENLKNVEEKNIITDSMAAFSYLYLKDEVNSLKAVQSLSEKYPNTYAGLYFKQLLKDKNLSVTLMDSLEDLIVFSNLILSTQISLSQDFIPKADILEIDQLSQIAELENREILKIAFQKSSFNKKKSVEAVLGTTLILESGKFYDLAFKNSLLALRDFADYKELFKYEFPLYYGDIISEYSKKYDVPQELIYTIIHTITGFNPYYISDDSKFGIMNIPYKDDSSLRFFELFDVNTNIEEGTKILKTLLDKYKGNKIKTLLAYVYGEEYLDLIYFGHTNDINFTSITIPEERFFLQNMFMTYIFYSRLYDF